MSESSAYRKEAWGCCYAGAKGRDLALPLELRRLDIARATFNLNVAIAIYISHHLHLPTALQLHLIAHHRLLKAVVRHIQGLDRLVQRKHASEGLGASLTTNGVG